MFWEGEFECSVAVNSEQLISLSCKHPEIPVSFNVTAVYAKCNKVDRKVLWNQLRSISANSNPWLVGVFNIVRKQEEMLGG